MNNNEQIRNIIENRRKELGLSLSELARRLNIPKSTLSRYKNLQYQYPLNEIQNFANVLDISADEILGLDKKDSYSKLKNDIKPELLSTIEKLNSSRQDKVLECAQEQLEEQEKEEAIPQVMEQSNIYILPKNLYESFPEDTIARPVIGDIAAGVPITAEENIVAYADAPAHFGNDTFWLEIKGDSMEPRIPDGARVLIKPCSDVPNGKIGAVRFLNDDVATLKYIYKEQEHFRLKLVSENPKYKPFYADAENPAVIVGEAVYLGFNI